MQNSDVQAPAPPPGAVPAPLGERSAPGAPDGPGAPPPGAVLSPAQQETLTQERRLLGALGGAITPLEPDPADLAALRQAGLDLEELFLLVIAGEFNAGKSAFINALLGERFLTEGVTPTTAVVTLLRYGDQPSEQLANDDLMETAYPAPFLRDITVVDTPGTNAIIRRHEQLTRHFVPRADLVLFVTSADRPFTESERAFLETIRDWGKKIVIILNKIDLMSNAADLQHVIDFIAENARALLGVTPEIFPVSARLALQGKTWQATPGPQQAQGAALLRGSRFDQLEAYIFQTLDEAGRLRLKFLTPLGVAERVLERYRAAAGDRLTVLADDFKTTENIDAQLEVYQTDMRDQFTHRLADIENIIYELRERGDAFFDQMVTITHIRQLMNREWVRGAFERDVVADSAARVDQAVQGLIDWMVDHDLRMWQAVQEYLDRRQAVRGREDQMIGQIGRQFEYNRAQLLESVGRKAGDVVRSYDREHEALDLAEEMRGAVQRTIGAAGLAGIGVILSIAITAAAFDATMIVASTLAAAFAAIVLPLKKRQAKAAFHQKVQELRESLARAMTEQFTTELARSVERIYAAIAPYTRFVKAEHNKVSQSAAELDRLRDEFTRLRRRIEG
ncbi:MAG TPA: dynamin family protein [Chloroflexia bacterium]|nr:dynamin family protein [Chloroflexia bacterium]